LEWSLDQPELDYQPVGINNSSSSLSPFYSEFSLASHSLDKKNGNDEGKVKRVKSKSACTRCKSCKSVCGDERPCPRCVRLGYADSCVDAPKPPKVRKEGKKKRKRSQSQEEDQVEPLQKVRNISPPAQVPFHEPEKPTTMKNEEIEAEPIPLPDPALESANHLLESLMEGLLTGQTNGFSAISEKSAATNESAGQHLRQAYIRNVKAELEKWHQRILSGELNGTIPMYSLYCRHFLETASSYSVIEPEELERSRVELLSNLPQNDLAQTFLTESVVYSSKAEEIGDKVSNLVYQKMPIAVMKFCHDNCVIKPIFANDYATSLFGLKEQDFNQDSGFMITKIFHSSCWFDFAVALCSAVVNRQDTFQYKAVCVEKDGTPFDCIITVQMEFIKGPIPQIMTCFLQKC